MKKLTRDTPLLNRFDRQSRSVFWSMCPFLRLHGDHRVTVLILTALVCFLSGCQPLSTTDEPVVEGKGDEFMVVDCLLPGQIRQIGQKARYLSARRPIKASASECAIRGGEFTAYDRADYATGLKVWLEQAKTGDAEAQTYVGEIYEKGLGLSPDYEVASVWYRRAAEKGFTRAQINLGNLYEKGLGVDKNSIKALNWYRRASGLDGDKLQYASTVVANNQLQKELASLSAKVSDLRAYKSQVEAEKKEQKNIVPQPLVPQPLVSQTGEPHKKEPLAATEIARDEILIQNSLNSAPNIMVIDPPISLTRSGPTALLRNAVASKEIIGKVQSELDIRSFRVNSLPIELDEFNLFFVDVPIVGQKTEVLIEAIDEKAQKVGFQFSMFLDPATTDGKSPRVISFDPATQTPLYEGINFGRYYALVIGNKNYQFYKDLETPENDARLIAQLLRERYGFSTQLLLNASRYEMLSALNTLRSKLTEKDNLLIYYAGHGELDAANERGYWLPVDAEPGNNTNWLSNLSISDQLNTFSAKHVMVVADSCYAGTLSTASVARQSASVDQSLQKEWLEVMNTVKARTVMTSGGVRPVLDSGGEGHSVFAKSFIDALKSNDRLMDGNSLFISVLTDVRKRSKELGVEQIPDYGAIKYAGHEAGEFFLVPAVEG